MIEQLFGSKTRVKLLYLFYSNPNRSFYVREITRKVEEQINSVRRELGNLLKIGIIKSDSSSNKLYYEVNQSYPHYEALRMLFTNMGAETSTQVKLSDDDMTKRFDELGAVEMALLSGVFTRDEQSPVDIMVVGDVNRHALEKLIKELEGEKKLELRYAVFDSGEYDYRKSLNDRFLSSVLHSKVTYLIQPAEAKEEAPEAAKEPAAAAAEPSKSKGE